MFSGTGSAHANPVFDCGGAKIRARSRHCATVVAVSGTISAANLSRLADHVTRFVLPDTPFVLDLSAVASASADALALLEAVDTRCTAEQVQWALIGSRALTALPGVGEDAAFPVVGSVSEALYYFDEATQRRRALLLPLLKKTA
ncbi:STAS domain-containing protein [Mycolicibacterium palauense]|uniref:STAS domain-containing protein n=1 Tax=Mycolicibacterium palauense TaxID=2034511 RepID=UPI000BFEDBC4|nr:STAS domain-containing protein [Mycolicibacterium palauense]